MLRVGRGLVVIAAMLFVVPAAPAGANHVLMHVSLTVTHALPGATPSVGDRILARSVRSPRGLHGVLYHEGRFDIDSLHVFENQVLSLVRMTGVQRVLSGGKRVGVVITSSPPLGGSHGSQRDGDVVIRWYEGDPSLERCGSESVAAATGHVALEGDHSQDPLDAAAWLAPFCASSLGDLAQLPS